MKTGQIAALTARISLSNSADREVLWADSDAKIVKVENGQLTALKMGRLPLQQLLAISRLSAM